ncbi:MAG TPA: D-alanyl-D-alanine carboxypeptidase [Sediminibacterium sp.]|nr:D-alanyl-D-alanine carboxypeptidase [Sediminibacterium sp.]
MKTNVLVSACLLFGILALSSCSIQQKIARSARTSLLETPSFLPAHTGISIYEPATGKYWYQYQSDKYFVPASNTKLLTCFAAMRHLGDSLIGIRYVNKGNGRVEVEGNADASFLMPDFKAQPVYEFLKQQRELLLTDANWNDNPLGMGWAWDDYNSDYMQERSAFPIYGNLTWIKDTPALRVTPGYLFDSVLAAVQGLSHHFRLTRSISDNHFYASMAKTPFGLVQIPFHTTGNTVLLQALRDTLHTRVQAAHFKLDRLPDVQIIHSQPTDSLLRIMMHRSDNFFAEQTLLMISNDWLGTMNDRKIIDTLLHSDYKDLPQKPKWVDGSGLSRYNLVTPDDLVWILTQMKARFPWPRIQAILATGGDGTLGSLYKNYKGKIYAKTGTLSNHVALSGFMITNKGKQLVFSILVNAHQTSAANIRKGIETFLTGLMDHY